MRETCHIMNDVYIESCVPMVPRETDWEYYHKCDDEGPCTCGPAAIYWISTLEIRDIAGKLLAKVYKSGDFDGSGRILAYHIYSQDVRVIKGGQHE